MSIAKEMLSLTDSEMDGLCDFSVTIEFLDWICENIEEGGRIVELGSGSTTEYLSRRYEMYSVEHDLEWCGTCEKSTYIHAPLLANKWYDPEKLFRHLPGMYDLLIIDGPPFKNISRECRSGILDHLGQLIDTIPWMIDDTNAKFILPLSRELSERTGRPVQFFSTTKKKKFGVLLPRIREER